jgi:VanZ family protein
MAILPNFRTLLDTLARWPLVVAWMALIFAMSSVPNRVQYASGPPIDKPVHAAQFGVLAFLLAWLAARRASPLRAVTAGVAGSLLFGLTDELHQAFVPGRDPSLGDLAADAAGAGIAAVAAYVLLRTLPQKDAAQQDG